jgi:hypothetical protein
MNPSPVFLPLAYLDPGAGSLVLQAIIGFVLGALVTVKLFWRRLRDAASNLFRRGADDRGSNR